MEQKKTFIGEKEAGELTGLGLQALYKIRKGKWKHKPKAPLPYYQYGATVVYDLKELLAWQALHHNAGWPDDESVVFE